MSAVDLDAVLAGLRSFQRDAVAHVAHQFYGPGASERSGRFLIADETGLGKSVIARGVVAHAIRELEKDDSVDRIDIVYICSNRDLASQNLKRLNVTGQREIAMATRLSLLAKESARLNQGIGDVAREGTKPINLVSFTPGTSFSAAAWRQGSADERALVVLLLDEILQQTAAEQHATRVLFQGTVQSVERFSRHYVGELARQLNGGIDAHIQQEFASLAESTGALAEFLRIRERISGDTIPGEIWSESQNVIARLRSLLAKSSVKTLEPDLVILDEFQRFHTLLDPENGGESAELADGLFSYPNAKVLLLSATPYKPFTQVDEDEEDHYEDFLATISFLCQHDSSRVLEVQDALRHYRQTLVGSGDVVQAAENVRAALIPLMTRSERPNVIAGRDLVEVKRLGVTAPSPSELREWMTLSQLGVEVGTPMGLEYWKSVPYFVNFMKHYKIGEKVHQSIESGAGRNVIRLLKKSSSLSQERISRKARIEPGNAPLRALMSETLDRGWWKLLWLPPSMPYLEPGPVFAPFTDGSVTKQVIFSAWSATPTSIATIMSHEAERRMAGVGSRGHEVGVTHNHSPRLNYRQRDDRGIDLSTLALFWPHPGLLGFADQLGDARNSGAVLTLAQLIRNVDSQLPDGDPAEQPWEAFFAAPGGFDPDLTDVQFAVAGERIDPINAGSVDDGTGALGLRANLAVAQEHAQLTRARGLTHQDLAKLVAFSPGNVAYRAVSAVAGAGCTPGGIWRAAFTIAESLRTLFNRSESQSLLDHLYTEENSHTSYWNRVLEYSADGNLRAVLDEYLFQLWCETGQVDVTDEVLEDLANSVAAAIGLRPARYIAHGADADQTDLPMSARFAVRYGGGEQAQSDTDATVARQSVVRAAFNSPFAPFVLASTSVGQEGIDFHWWSHSVVHWNLPSNPVDFEQREGRVNRYGGHAVRKNVASQHWSDVLGSEDPNAWRAAFDAASQVQTEAGEFSPWWVYPGPAKIQRVLVPYPLSRDNEQYDQLRSALTLYRLTLGQPRQGDMVEMLQKRNIDGTDVATIDLRPPHTEG